jgi:hypothetical protein
LTEKITIETTSGREYPNTGIGINPTQESPEEHNPYGNQKVVQAKQTKANKYPKT